MIVALAAIAMGCMQEPPRPFDMLKDPGTMLLLLSSDFQYGGGFQRSGDVAHVLGDSIAVTDVTEPQLLGKDFPAWAHQFIDMNGKLREVAVIVPFVPATPKIDGLIPRLRREIAVFRKIGGLKGLYVCVPAANDAYTRTYAAPLIRQAAREAGAETIEIGEYPSLPLAIRDLLVDARVDKRGWKLVSADSEQIDEGPAANAIDGNPATYWHTRYDPTLAKFPHELVVDMSREERFDGFSYTPRQDGGVNGRVKAYEFYASLDGKTWGPPEATGNLPNSAKPTRIHFPKPVTARFWRFVAKSEQNAGPWATAAEIDVLKAVGP